MKILIHAVTIFALVAINGIALAHGPEGASSKKPGIQFNIEPTHHGAAANQPQPVMEVSIDGQTIILKVTDADGTPIDTEFADAKTFITSGGKISTCYLWPAGGNVLSGTGDFSPDPDLRVEVKLNLPDREPVSKEFYPLK